MLFRTITFIIFENLSDFFNNDEIRMIIQWVYIYKIKILYSFIASVALNFHRNNFKTCKYFSILNLWSFSMYYTFLDLENFLKYFVIIF